MENNKLLTRAGVDHEDKTPRGPLLPASKIYQSEIAKSNIDTVIGQLNANPKTQKIVKAHFEPKISQILSSKPESKKKIEVAITDIILSSYFISGVKVTKENKPDIILTADAVILDVMNDYPNMSLSEVDLAFKMGAKGEFGDIYGVLSVRSFNTYLRSYLSLKENPEIKSCIYKASTNIVALLNPVQDISEEEKIKKGKASIYQSFCEFIHDKNSNKNLSLLNIHLGAFFYDMLIEHKIMNEPSKKEKHDIFKKAKEKHLAKLLNSKQIKEMQKFSALLDEYDPHISSNESKNAHEKIAKSAKSIIVERFIEQKDYQFWLKTIEDLKKYYS